MPPLVHIVFVPPPPLLVVACPDDVSDDEMCERGVPGGVLNPNSTGCPDHDRYGNLPLQGKSPTAEPGIEPGTSG
jgi:hypothetical protein